MTEALVVASAANGVGRLRLTRASKRNALSHALVDQALAAVDEFVSAGVVVAVLEADAPVFCAGTDVEEALVDPPNSPDRRFVEAIADTPIFWVAALSGPVLAAGVGVVATCPLAIATPQASLSLPEASRGFFPARVVPYLEALVGPRRAHELALSGRRLSAEEAVAWGLVTEVVDAARLDRRITEWTELLAARPQVAEAARRSWQGRFATPTFEARMGQLREILDAQELRL